jgi:DNA polymerase III delta prime subunit
MRVTLGFDAYTQNQRGENRPVLWDETTAINPHWLITGGSGTGKTYTLRRVLSELLKSAQQDQQPVRVHVFDVHGDLDLPGASTVRFSEASEFGFNPLIVNPDPHFGGVRRKIQSILDAMNRTSHSLGPKQEAALRALLTDVYAANGFYADKPASWRLPPDAVGQRKHPALNDVIRFGRAKLKQLYLGADTKTVAALDEVNALMRRHYNAQRAAQKAAQSGDTDAADKANAQIESLAAKAKDAFALHLDQMKTGREFDEVLKYDSRDVLKSVVDRLENLNGIGIFKPMIPPFDRNAAIWRYDLTALPPEESKLFVWFRLEALFANAMQRGESPRVRDLIVLDEAHRYASNKSDDATNPIDTIAREARKFGLGLMGISQAPSHFPEDFLANVATKVLLGIDEMYWEASIRKLKIAEKTLKYIRPKQTLAVQIKASGDTRNTFQEVSLLSSPRIQRTGT